MASVEQRIDALYGLPLDEFTAARNALARELKQSGDAGAAERVSALRKPAAAVWAINQAARLDKLGVRRLIKAADELRTAQQAALSGSIAELDGAQQRERQAVHAFARAAAAALPGNTQLDRIERTVRAAAIDPAARELLEHGRLTTELEPAGFEALAGMKLPARRPRQAPPPDDRAERRRELRKAAQAAERQARELEREAERAVLAAERARRAADEAAAARDAL